MSDLVGNPEDRFSRVAAHIIESSKLNYANSSNDDRSTWNMPRSQKVEKHTDIMLKLSLFTCKKHCLLFKVHVHLTRHPHTS